MANREFAAAFRAALLRKMGMTRDRRDDNQAKTAPSEVVPIASASGKERTLSPEQFAQFAKDLVAFEWDHQMRREGAPQTLNAISSLDELNRVATLKSVPQDANDAPVSPLSVKRRTTVKE